jgi:hypothetical protein
VRSPFELLLIAFALFWIGAASRAVYKQLREGSSPNWVVGISGFLIIVGAIGFFGSALVAEGTIIPSTSFEWPAGHANHAVNLSDGGHAIGLEPVGRVQLYDSAWHFVRGWQIDAKGGDFSIVSAEDDLLNVYTARSRMLYVFSDAGKLVSSASYSQGFSDIPRGGSLNVPTSPLLWPFSSPFGCWALIVLGSLGMRAAKKMSTSSLRP